MSIERLQIIDLELASSTSQLQALLLHEIKRLEMKFEFFSFSKKASMIERIIQVIDSIDPCRVLQRSTKTRGFFSTIQQYMWQMSCSQNDAHCMFIVIIKEQKGISYAFEANMSDLQVLDNSEWKFSSTLKEDDILFFAKRLKSTYDRKYSEHLNIEDFNDLKKNYGYNLLKTVCGSFVKKIQDSMPIYNMSRYNRDVHPPELFRLQLFNGSEYNINDDAYKCFRYSTNTEDKALSMNLMQFISTVPKTELEIFFNKMKSAMTLEHATVELVKYNPIHVGGRLDAVFQINSTEIANEKVRIHSRIQGYSSQNSPLNPGVAWIIDYDIDKPNETQDPNQRP